jgi:NAD(P)-dependent dehydrogenase (short-subunit alcohol dehydrogenase family)
MGRLDGKVALVTGASGGLGEHFAETLGRAGAKTVLAARRLDKLEEVADRIRAAGGEALSVELDVTDSAAVPAAFDAAEAAFGTVTVLVNNSGIVVPGSVPDLSEADWDSVLDTNLKGEWVMAQTAARRMIAAGTGGSIVNLASALAFRVQRALATYAISKAAVAQMTRAMAYELAEHDIRVNALAPGYIVTNMNRDFLLSRRGQEMMREVPIGRYGEMEELDEILLLLAGDNSKYMTGAVIPIDGGQTLGIRD